MKGIRAPAYMAVSLLCPAAASADDSYRSLDTRTRCIVLLRECLVLIEQRDIDGIFEIVADGTGGSNFKIYPNPAAISAELKQERQNANTFIERNFRNHRVINSAFSNLQFSDLKTAKKSVTVTNTENNKKADAKLHSIKVKIPLQDRYEFGELRFLEMAENIYWVPIGW